MPEVALDLCFGGSIIWAVYAVVSTNCSRTSLHLACAIYLLLSSVPAGLQIAFFGSSQPVASEQNLTGGMIAVPSGRNQGQQQQQGERERKAGREDEQAVAKLVDEAADVGVIDVLLTYPLMRACHHTASAF